jgi:copper transport protein
MTTLRSGGISCLLLLGWLAMMCAPAGAHALLRSTQPTAGAQLNSAPSRIVLAFTETPDPTVSSVQLLDASGAPLQEGSPRVVAGRPSALQISLGRLSAGTYTVSWRVVSKVDGHLTAGSFAFGVGEAPSGGSLPSGTAAGTTPSPAPISVIGRWALYWGLALLLAAAVTRRLVWQIDDPRMDRALLGAWVIALVGITLMVVSVRSTIGVSLSDLLRSSTGQNLAEQAGATAVAGLGVLLVVMGRRSGGYLIAGIGSLGAMWFHAAGSHAEQHMTWFNVPVQFVHIVAAGIWVGGLVWLLVALRGAPVAERAARVRRFSVLAGTVLAVVAITGTFRALDETGSIGKWRDSLSTSFGITLLIKIGLFLVLGALAARNHYVNVPGFSKDETHSGRLTRTVRGEVLLAALILAVTGVLSQLPPPVDVASAASTGKTADVVATGHDFATSVKVKLTVTPGTPGRNKFEARVSDFDTGQAVQAKAVTLGFSLPARADVGASSLNLSRTPSSAWTGTGTNLSIAGRWAVTVTIQEAATAVEVPLTVTTRSEPQAISTQTAPGQPTIYSISLPTGGKLQTYIDPGKAGINNVHFTFFTPGGQEESITNPHVIATDPNGQQQPMALIRFSKGHFVANAQLSTGTWGFAIDAQTRSGVTVSGHFEQNIM